MKWVGLTGGIGSGKSSVTKLFRKHGIPVVDADAIAREVVLKGSPGLAAVVKSFGAHILDPEGSLDRKVLGELVFGKIAELSELESILHPLIQAKVLEERRMHEASGAPVALYDVPLLYEKNLEKQFDHVLVVWAPLETQIHRVMARDGLDREAVLMRLKSQMPLDEKKHRANFVIDNSGNMDALEMCVAHLAMRMQEKGAKGVTKC